VVFEGWGGTWEEVRALDARSAELIAWFERVCHPYRDQEIPVDDFVHGDLNVSNLIVAEGIISGPEAERLSPSVRPPISPASWPSSAE
jgi:hypothetical protein